MKRGEIYLVELAMEISAETDKVRPAIIISNNFFNSASPLITIIPISSRLSKVYPFQVLLNEVKNGLDKDSKAKCEQIRTINKLRLKRKIGQLSKKQQEQVNNAIKLHLNFR